MEKQKAGKKLSTKKLQSRCSLETSYKLEAIGAELGLNESKLIKRVLDAFCNSEAVRNVVEGYYHK